MKPCLTIIIFLCSILCSCSERQTILIDGNERSKDDLTKLDKTEIFSYSKWKSGEAPPWYGKWNNTTLIVVKTKTIELQLQQERHVLLSRFLDSLNKGADILVVLDGILLSDTVHTILQKLSANELSNVDTMGYQASKDLYGPPAKSMTLIVNTYDNTQ